MILLANLTALLIVLGALAAATALAGVLIARAHPPKGRFVAVEGGRLHIDELGGRPDDETAVVLVHGASGNMEDMRIALGDALCSRFRTILIDRPGRGWSERSADREAASPQAQADSVAQALEEIGVKHAVMVGHSWGGALASAFAIRHPDRIAGLVLLAPTSHPWKGGVSWYYGLAVTPLIGPVFAHTMVLPLGMLLMSPATKGVFAPQTPPDHYISDSSTSLVLRPKAFAANARDMTELKRNLEKLVPLYPKIEAPTVIIVGDRDLAVSNHVHAFALMKAIPKARLEVLTGVGHVPHHARPDRVVAAIEDVLERSAARAFPALSESKPGLQLFHANRNFRDYP